MKRYGREIIGRSKRLTSMRIMLFLLASTLWAGQSIILNNQTAQNTSVPAVSPSTPWISETYVDVIPSTLVSNPWFLKFNEAATGLSIELSNGCAPNLCILAAVATESGASPSLTCNGTVGLNLPTLAFYIRYQHLVSALTDSCEVWDTNGNEVFQGTATFASQSAGSNGAAVLGGATDAEHIAFNRLCTGATLPVGSRMPVTAGGCPAGTIAYEWKFDGSLADASSNGYTASLNSGSPSYATTLYQNVIAVLKTLGAPFWSNWVSLRAGAVQQLDGTSSFSEADASSAVTYFWQMLAGASPVTWSSHTASQPTLSGLIHGGYTPQLTVTDTTGAINVASLQIGAVATDSNGVVVNANPAADQIYGPMIAFGQNPWGLQDKLALQATTLRSAKYNTFPGNPPTWDQPLAGTVSYPFVPIPGTTLNGGINATTLTITITDATQLDLTSFPTIIQIGGINGFAGEEVVICSAATNVLTACYDGRGFRYGSPFGGSVHPIAQSWPNGAAVTQYKVTGSGTSLLATFNPLGAGWSGPNTAIASTGTCSATAGSAAVTGSGTNWTSLNNAGYAIRISGTHSSTPFTFFAYVSAVSSTTALTLNRVYPSDADTASSLTCVTFQPDQYNMVLHYGRCGSGSYAGCNANSAALDGSTYWYTDGCFTNTSCYLYEGHDPNSIHPTYGTCLSSPPYAASTMECSKQVAYMNGFGYVGDNTGVNFYDEGLAHMALYLRSGWQPALDAFRKVEGQDGTTNRGYMFYPEMAENDVGVAPRRASVLGMWAAYLLDGKTSNLSGLRNFANETINLTSGFTCNSNDLREGIGYPLHWLAMSATQDPNASSLNYPTALGSWYSAISPCAGTGAGVLANSWANGFLWANNQTPALTATNGSAILTGSGIANNQICGTTPSATGTATVTHNSDVVTGSGFVTGGGKIMFEDGILGLITFDYIFDSSSQVHLSGLYPGNTATITYWINTDSSFNGTGFDSSLVFASSNNDSQLTKQWNCTWNNSGQITLDRPWDGSSGTVWGWRGNLGGVGGAGFGTEPFYVGGILSIGHRLASQIGGTLGTNFTTLGVNAATWTKNYGYDPLTGGAFYGRVFPVCEPVYTDSTQPQNFTEAYRNPQCNYNGWAASPTFAKQIARGLTGEMASAAWLSYQSDSTTKSFWDTFYANSWDVAPYTQMGFGTDGLGSENCGPAENFALGKWTGFCFGIGASAQWPAARLGGVAPAVPENITVTGCLAGNSCSGAVANATKYTVTLTEPDGLVVSTTCTTATCVVTGDVRQGNHLLQITYLSAGNAVLAQGDPYVLVVQ